MHRLYSMVLPLLILGAPPAADAPRLDIPTIPTLLPPGPPTTGIVATDDGVVYFVDSFHSVVWRVPPGRAPAPHVTGRNGRTLQIDADGRIVGTHREPKSPPVAWRADAAGRITDVPDGDDVAYHRSLHYNTVTATTRTDDGFFLVTSGSSIHRVGVDGSVRTIAADEPRLRGRGSILSRLLGASQDHLTSVAEDGAGNVYVTNAARGAVVVVKADGTVEDVVTAANGWTPTGVAASRAGLFVLEYGNGVRVRHIAADGTRTTVAIIRPDRATSTVVAALPGRLGRS